MMLHETRIVLIEKTGQGEILDMLSLIDENIKLMSFYFPDAWLKNKIVRKVLEDNGYRIFKNTRSGRNSSTSIRHNRYE